LLADFTRMHDSYITLAAAVDPAGPFAAVCGITWTLLCPTSGVAAIVSAALCPFRRTARQALRLSRVGVWTGSIAFLVATVATVATAGFPKDPPESVAEAVLLISLTAIAPILAFFAGRFSRRRIIKLETEESANKALQPTATLGILDGTANPTSSASPTPPSGGGR